MSAHFDADAFSRRRLTFNGAEYTFRPATLRDQFDYLKAEIKPRFDATTSENERNTILIEVIRKFIPEIPEEALWDTTLSTIWGLYYYVVNGIPPEAEGKN